MLKRVNKTLIASSIALSLSSMSIYAQDVEVDEGVQLGFDIIFGQGEQANQFINLDSGNSLLSVDQWYEIQAYANEALALPADDNAAFRAFVQFPEDATEAEFNQSYVNLENTFTAIHQHAFEWNESLYPNMVDLALRLGNYTDIHTRYIERVHGELDDIVCRALAEVDCEDENGAIIEHDDEYTVEMAIRDLETASRYLSRLKTFSDAREAETNTVKDNLATFNATLEVQSQNLSSSYQAFAELIDEDHLDELQSTVDELLRDRKQLRKELNEANRNFRIAAATGPGGMMAYAAISAAQGKEFDPAEIKKQINKINRQLAEARAEHQHAANMHLSLTLSQDATVEMSNAITTAEPHLRAVQSHWQGLSASFDDLSGYLDFAVDSLEFASDPEGFLEDIAYELQDFAQVDINDADDTWQEIGDKARSFAQNAYLTIEIDDTLGN